MSLFLKSKSKNHSRLNSTEDPQMEWLGRIPIYVIQQTEALLYRKWFHQTQLIEVLFPIACGTYPPNKRPRKPCACGVSKIEW
jgi:hypothetical protein